MNYKLILSSIALSFSLLWGNAAQYYVSPTVGCDTNDGSFGTPFKTLHRAQTATREAVASGIDEDITIYLREGRHTLDQTLVLSFEDVAKGHNLTFKAYQDEEPIITSGVNIVGWQPLEEYPEGTPDVAKGKIWVADAPNGVSQFKTLFDGESRLERAKSATFTHEPINDKVEKAASRNVEHHYDRYALKEFPFDDQIKDWDNIGDVELFFNPVPWALNFISINAVDMEKRIAYLDFESNSIPFLPKPEQRFAWVENIIDYLDEPGEWCLDSKKGKIYYWPQEGRPSDDILAPKLMEYIRVEGKIQYDMAYDLPLKNIHFEGLSFSHGERSVWYENRKGWGIQHDWDTFDYGNAMVRFRGAEDCSVTECKFTNSGGSAIRLDLHAQNIHISKNYISNVGHMGILLCGYGPGTKYVNRGNIIENNIITEVGEIIWHGHAIFAWQSGENIIRNNYIHDVPRKAIGLCGVRCYILMKPDCNFDEASMTIRWREILPTIDNSLPPLERYAKYLHSRDNIIENNHVFNCLQRLLDGASINISGAGTGNIVRHNLFTGGAGFRNDDWQNGSTLESNIFYNGGAIVHKGCNDIRNNIQINSPLGIRFRLYPGQEFDSTSDITGNIFYNTNPNFEFNTTEAFTTKDGVQKELPYAYDNFDYNGYCFPNAEEYLQLHQEGGVAMNSVVADPEFEDVGNMKLNIKNKKLLKAIGFEEFDTSIDSFGITPDYPSKYRALDSTLSR